MCRVIKLELNLNQTVIRFNKPTNTDSAGLGLDFMHAACTDCYTRLHVGLLAAAVELAMSGRNTLINCETKMSH